MTHLPRPSRARTLSSVWDRTIPGNRFRTEGLMNSKDLSLLYPPHVTEVARRTTEALSRSGFDGVILQSGEGLGWFLDDQHYPYKAHAPFKWWVPLRDAPGSLLYFQPGQRPKLVFFVATDFWYQPAELPKGGWADHL
ncbi:MAG: hypothetical protein EB102_07510, partial [Gammaproteobacteria bacterium]|nr:hypothetical protein [Gammaproteobacteria bacterium]